MLEKKPFKLTPKIYLAIIAIGLCNSIVFTIPYIKYTFYYGMLEMTGCTNEQLGLLMTIYGLGELFGLPIGGLLADKVDSRVGLCVSTAATGLLCFLLVAHPTYGMTALVWFLLIFTSLFIFWGAIFKGLRELAPAEYQGRMVGFYSGASGIGYWVVNTAMVPVYDKYSQVTDGKGMVAVFIFFGFICFIYAVGAWFLIGACRKEQQANGWDFLAEEGEAPDERGFKGLISDLKEVVKYKSVWIFGLVMFGTYGIQITLSYTEPFFTDVLGMTVVFGAFLSVMRYYGMQAIGAPVQGYLSDKLGGASRVVAWGNILTIVILILLLVLPTKTLQVVPFLIAIILLGGFFNSGSYGAMFALPTEGKVPARLYAAAVGLSSAIGYIPDIFEHTMYGRWLDKSGNAAYPPIFIFGIAVSAMAVIALIVFRKNKARGTMIFGQKPGEEAAE